jgi:hypothetical protein
MEVHLDTDETTIARHKRTGKRRRRAGSLQALEGIDEEDERSTQP